jgi:hypothetical protein
MASVNNLKTKQEPYTKLVRIKDNLLFLLKTRFKFYADNFELEKKTLNTIDIQINGATIKFVSVEKSKKDFSCKSSKKPGRFRKRKIYQRVFSIWIENKIKCLWQNLIQWVSRKNKSLPVLARS